eukprot:SAG31_NODE_2287_length_6004_cov_2.142954_1_plen_249_part_00
MPVLGLPLGRRIWAVQIDAAIAGLLKIAVHREARDDWPSREDLLLDRPLRDQPAEGAALGPMWHPRAIGGVLRALLLALAGVASVPLRVGVAFVAHEPLRDDVLAGGGLVASRAGRLEAEGVAVQQLLRAQHDVDAAGAGDAEPVAEGLGRTERPARSAPALVADGVDAARPSLPRVESGGEHRLPARHRPFLRASGAQPCPQREIAPHTEEAQPRELGRRVCRRQQHERRRSERRRHCRRRIYIAPR